MSSNNPGENLDFQHQRVTESTILYLLQEANKLATPAHEERLSSLHRENESTASFALSDCDDALHSHHSCSEFTGCFSVLREAECSSAWEVMSLINQQCEKLLDSGCWDGEQVDLDSEKSSELTETVTMSVSPSTAPFELSCPAGSPIRIPADGCLGVIYSSEQTQYLTDMTDEEEMKESGSLAELILTNAADVSQSRDICLSDTSKSCFTENTVPLREESGSDQSLQCHNSLESVIHREPVGSNSENPGSEICPLDFTSSLVSERDCENVWLSLNTHVHQDSTSSRLSDIPADFNNNLIDTKELQESEDTHESSSIQPRWGSYRRTQRKQPRPARSPDPQHADIQGVMFSMHTELDTSTDQCRLLITSNYSEDIYKRSRRFRSSRSKSLQTSHRTSSSEEESDSCSLSRSKMCASCCTRKTPLWRDAEDGTPLCNACGIRYKKYRVRCQQCWNIPKKDANTNSKCLKCGDMLRLNSQQKRIGSQIH